MVLCKVTFGPFGGSSRQVVGLFLQNSPKQNFSLHDLLGGRYWEWSAKQLIASMSARDIDLVLLVSASHERNRARILHNVEAFFYYKGKKIVMKGALEQVVELFRAPASVGCCCSGVAKMPTLRQRVDALALKFMLQVR